MRIHGSTNTTNYICACGLFPYILNCVWLWYKYEKITTQFLTCFIIFNNGILFHLYFPNNLIVKYYDICVNVFFITMVNILNIIDSNFKETIVFCTLTSLTIFLLNFYFLKNYYNLTNYLHVIGVQWILFYALINSKEHYNFTVISFIKNRYAIFHDCL